MKAQKQEHEACKYESKGEKTQDQKNSFILKWAK
jgi:hypothetical protein